MDDPPLVGIERLHRAGLAVRADLLGETLRLLGQRLVAPLAEALAADTQRDAGRAPGCTCAAAGARRRRATSPRPSSPWKKLQSFPRSWSTSASSVSSISASSSSAPASATRTDERPQARPRVGRRRLTGRLGRRLRPLSEASVSGRLACGSAPGCSGGLVDEDGDPGRRRLEPAPSRRPGLEHDVAQLRDREPERGRGGCEGLLDVRPAEETVLHRGFLSRPALASAGRRRVIVTHCWISDQRFEVNQ